MCIHMSNNHVPCKLVLYVRKLSQTFPVVPSVSVRGVVDLVIQERSIVISLGDKKAFFI